MLKKIDNSYQNKEQTGKILAVKARELSEAANKIFLDKLKININKFCFDAAILFEQEGYELELIGGCGVFRQLRNRSNNIVMPKYEDIIKNIEFFQKLSSLEKIEIRKIVYYGKGEIEKMKELFDNKLLISEQFKGDIKKYQEWEKGGKGRKESNLIKL